MSRREASINDLRITGPRPAEERGQPLPLE